MNINPVVLGTEGTLGLLQGIMEIKRRIGGPSSLSEFAMRTMVRPRVLIESSLRGQSFMKDLLQHATNTFTGFYTSAAKLLDADVVQSQVLERMDRLNPNREPVLDLFLSNNGVGVSGGAGGNAVVTAGGMTASFEEADFEDGLPFSCKLTMESKRNRNRQNPEDAPDDDKGNGGKDSKSQQPEVVYKRAKDNEQLRSTADRVAMATTITASEDNGLAVGKIFSMKFRVGNENRELQLACVLLPMVSDPASVISILSMYTSRQTLKERWHGLRSGGLTASEFFFMTDIAKKHKATLRNDKSGYYAEQMRLQRSGKLAGLVSGMSSLATASAMIITTTQSMVRAELEVGRPISDYQTREAMMAANNSFIWYVVDTEWQTVRQYVRGMEQAAEWNYNELKKASKGDGVDIVELVKAFSSGRPLGPSF